MTLDYQRLAELLIQQLPAILGVILAYRGVPAHLITTLAGRPAQTPTDKQGDPQ